MPQNLDQVVSNLHFTITTGSDDVRQNSQVNATLTILEGEQESEVQQSLNNGANWPNSNINQADMAIPSVKVRDIRSFGIDILSGSTGPFDTEDDWNMKGIQATYTLDTGGIDILFEQDGQPLHRFTGSDPTWEIDFNWLVAQVSGVNSSEEKGV